MKTATIRSPFFYVGDKYKLMPQLKKLMPPVINLYIEPFVGGGSSFLNTSSAKYLLNDIDFFFIEMHKEFAKYTNNKDKLFKCIFEIIKKYKFSCSYLGITVPDELKKEHHKTYYAKYNQEAYLHLKSDFNNNKDDLIKLYVLLIYGFNHMIRFNKKGDFNLPVGNVDFNKNVFNALNTYLDFISCNNIEFFNCDYIDFIDGIHFLENSYIFFDPPYLISMSEYNKKWNDNKEIQLCDFLDFLDKKDIKFGITNLITHKDKTNATFLHWSQKYYTFDICSNYISYNDNTIKKSSREVFVTNVKVN